MAHPNEDLVRRAYDAFSQGDIETLRQLFAATPHHVHVVPASSPEVAAAPNCCSRFDGEGGAFGRRDRLQRTVLQSAHVRPNVCKVTPKYYWFGFSRRASSTWSAR